MISPDPAPASGTTEATDRFFASDGPLEQHCTDKGIDFELRPQQRFDDRVIECSGNPRGDIHQLALTLFEAQVAVEINKLVVRLTNRQQGIVHTRRNQLVGTVGQADDACIVRGAGLDLVARGTEARAGGETRCLFPASVTARDWRHPDS